MSRHSTLRKLRLRTDFSCWQIALVFSVAFLLTLVEPLEARRELSFEVPASGWTAVPLSREALVHLKAGDLVLFSPEGEPQPFHYSATDGSSRRARRTSPARTGRIMSSRSGRLPPTSGATTRVTS